MSDVSLLDPGLPDPMKPDGFDLLSMQTPNPKVIEAINTPQARARIAREETEAVADTLIPRPPRPASGGLQGEMQAAGFTDEEIVQTLTQRQTEMRTAGFTEAEITMALVGNVTPPKILPQPFIDRLITGSALSRVYKAIGKGAGEGFGPGAVGIDPGSDVDKFLEDTGIFGKPGDASPIRLLNEAVIYPAAALGDVALRAVGAGFTAAGFGIAAAADELNPFSDAGTPEGERRQERSGKEITEALDIIALLSLGTPFVKARRGVDGTLTDQKVGGLPTPADFGNSARILAGTGNVEEVQRKLIRLWEERGIHPAEAAAAAVDDVTVTQKLLSISDDLPEGSVGTGRRAADTPQTLVAGGGGRRPPPDEEIIPPPKGEGPIPIEAKPVVDVTSTQALDEAYEAIRSKISIGETGGDAWNAADLYAKALDRLYGLQQAEKGAAGKLIEEAVDSPTKLARLMSGGPLKAQRALKFGMFDFFNPAQTVSKGLEAILKPIRKFAWMEGKRPMEAFSTFLASARAVELEMRGIKSGFDVDAAMRVVNSAPPIVKQAAMELYDFQNKLAAYLRDAGILSPAGYDAMLEANKFYIPFHRLFEEEALRGGGRSFQAFNPVKYIKGSEREIVDPLETIVRNVFTFINLADRNVVGTKLIDLLLKFGKDLPKGAGIIRTEGAVEDGLDKVLSLFRAGANRPIDEAADDLFAAVSRPDAHGHYTIFRQGRKETYLIDPDLARVLKGVDEDTANLLVRILNIPASTLRAGAVLNPEFMTRFLFRDFFLAQATFPGVFTPLDSLKGMVGLIIKDEDYIRWATSGGGNSSIASLDRRFLQESLDELTSKTGLTTRAWNVIMDPQSSMVKKLGAGLGWGTGLSAANRYIIHPLRLATSIALEANKLGAFKKAMRGKEATKANLTEAAWISRETGVDPARIGANMRSWNMISAFANATMQDPVRLARAIKDRPVQTLLAGLIGVTLPSVLLWLTNKDDSRYKGLPSWQRDLFWIVLTDDWKPAAPIDAVGRPADQVKYINGVLHVNKGVIWRLPKPFAWGIMFGSGAERLLEQYFDESGKSATETLAEFGGSLWSSSVPSMVPTGMVPLIEQFANTLIFSGNTVVPGYLEKMLPEYEYTPYTHETTKILGALVGAFPGMTETALDESATFGGVARALTTPAILENYINAWTGTLGHYALKIADQALIKSGVIPDPVKPEATLADIPFIRAFVVRYPSAQEENIQRFYREFTRNEQFFQTWKTLLEQGDVEGAKRVQELGGETMMIQLTKIRQALGTHSRLIRDVYRNPNYSPAEKRQLIDSYYFRMTELVRAGNAIFDGVRK